jgi:aromatic-amino-acid transaminase
MSVTAPTAPSFLAPARRGRPGDDPIFALNAEAVALKARGEAVVNATLGALLDDQGALAILPTAARAVREVPAAEWAGYAPIAGNPAFLQAVIRDLFPARDDLRRACAAAATPGGTGALRHAIAAFLEPGQRLLSTSFYWGPYATLAEENERGIDTFRMFDPQRGSGGAGALDLGALDAALARHLETQGRALLILNDPCHNPTGYSMSAADWAGVAALLERHAARGSVAVVLDGAYCAYGPDGDLSRPLAALTPLADRLLLLVAWTASKTFTHYGLRVGALVALVPDAAQRADVQAALTFACRGTWSNCNRGGLVAVTRLLTDPTLARDVAAERAGLVRLLGERVAVFNREAQARGLAHPSYEGGFFVTVMLPRAAEVGVRMKAKGAFAVPVDGGLRLGLCAVPAADVPRLVGALADSL